MKIEHLDNESFENAIKGAKTPVLVDFFATWCGPCKMLAPVLESVQDEIGEKAKIYKLDVDEGMEVAKRFGIMSVPTMIIFKNGEEVERLVGLRSKSEIIATIEAEIWLSKVITQLRLHRIKSTKGKFEKNKKLAHQDK